MRRASSDHLSEKASNENEKADGHHHTTTTTALPYGGEDLEFAEEIFTPEDLVAGRPFPEESLPEEEGTGLTIRALLVGSALGCVIAASNIYLGLKTGFTFAASLFGAILGFGAIKALSRVLPYGWGGAPFGPKENVTVQSAATAAGGLTGMFVAAVPAMYRLGLLNNPTDDFGRLFTFCLAGAFYGNFFAIPLRKFFILKLKLVFPTPTATALTIRALHTKRGAEAAKKKTKALIYTFIVCVIFMTANQYVPGILYDQHIFYWIWSWGGRSALVVDSWGWYTEITPAFIGSGMLAGLNASWSFMGGLFLAWAVIGPSLVATGQAHCTITQEMSPTSAFSCTSMKFKSDLVMNSPRYWLLWPGVLIMFGYSFAEVFMNGKAIARGFQGMYYEVVDRVRGRPVREVSGDAIEDPAPPEQQVQTWVWAVGLAMSVVLTVVVCSVQFDMNVGNVFLALILSFLLSVIGVMSSGTTDVNPLSAVAKATQLIVGGAVKGQGKTGNPALLENLLAGSIASNAASQSVDMVGDLKTGHWLRASPRSQFWAQTFGSVFATPLAVGLYVLFTKAYPCINSGEEKCTFLAPSVGAWTAVAQAVVSPTLPITKACGITAIMLTVAAIATVIAKHTIVKPEWRPYVPNWNAIALGFIVPQQYYGIAMVSGATAAYYWQKRSPKSADLYLYAIAAGGIAGEGIAGVISAALEVGKVSGTYKGTTVGLPPF
ncbi:OPT superfamily oligopeptide transporter [Acaromyces ingoldii]|uniref:OPT superfamily oligopeptide transporter n=1 Tax=Acaromyces ingoldii TaxID=215250 RepID=A0A316YZ11_9BASI|nr:OPT superfamily oligopeptide transporter [Acaromyces ingoldii]PWN93293.1 OPT superfamily oligopeptide transporter [Acaromyces ingoldii]